MHRSEDSTGLSRRRFLGLSAASAAAYTACAVGTARVLGRDAQPTPVRSVPVTRAGEPAFRTALRKALISSRPSRGWMEKLKAAGFDGIEAGVLPPAEAEAIRKEAEATGVKIHSVLRGWAEFNSADADRARRSYERTEDALRAAEAFGADAILLVPCRVGGVKVPRPWEFHIEIDERTGHLRRVTRGDNAPFADYIRAHDHATDTSRAAIEKLIPLAEKTGVVIAVENVWNHLWVKPEVFRHFVSSFGSRWVRAYFDIGNHVKYAPPEQWILALDELIVKCHVKDFRLEPSDPGGGGKFVNIRDGSVRWPVVRHALERVGYSGWMTIEGGNLSMEEHSGRLDQIIAGR